MSRRRISVRLEGGIGDHILGMRVLPFARRHAPDANITVYSDAGGGTEQVEVAQMSPDIDFVTCVRHKRPPEGMEHMGLLENVEEAGLEEMHSADIFLDAWGADYFASASRLLDVPVFNILAARPRISPPDWAVAEAERIAPACPLVGMNLTKYGAAFPGAARPILEQLLGRLLTCPDARFLHFYRTSFDFAHWPEPERSHRVRVAEEELRTIDIVNRWHERIVPVVDQPLAVVAALMQRCAYFIGVDNGIKHLAWALDVPRTVIIPNAPEPMFVTRWIPDYHRAIVLGGGIEKARKHAEQALLRLYRSIPRREPAHASMSAV